MSCLKDTVRTDISLELRETLQIRDGKNRALFVQRAMMPG